MFRKLVIALAAVPLVALAAEPRIAVTDLAYEEKVAHYFEVVSYKDKQRWNDSSHSSAGGSSHDRSAGNRDTELFAAAGDIVKIERGELRKFTADIKGEMLKSGAYRLVQAKPYTAKENEKLYDVIDRIKKGYFPNADYVLFASITSIEPRQEVNPVQGSGSSSASLAMELLIDCSLINTKTYEIKAAFSAMGEGQDVRLVTAPGQRVHLSSGKVMREVSKSLGVDVASQLEAQFDPNAGRRQRAGAVSTGAAAQEKVIEYR